MQYNVKIDAFEGPLDLLLHLINHLEIDIYDIPVADSNGTIFNIYSYDERISSSMWQVSI